MTQRNGFLMFIASCLSGCGQMYQGYMKRGLSLLLAFFLVIFVSTYFYLGTLVLFLPVIWLYAFFDSYALRSQLAAGTAPEDAFLFGLSDMDSKRLGELLRRRHSLIGWVLVAVGAYMLYDIVLDQLANFLVGWTVFGSRLVEMLRYGVPRLVITALVILLGLWFIRGPKAKAPIDDEIPPFAPPTSGTGPVPEAGGDSAEEAAADISAAGNAPEEEEARRDEQL